MCWPVSIGHSRIQLNQMNRLLGVSPLGHPKKKGKTNWVLYVNRVYQPGLQTRACKTPQGYKTNSWKFRFMVSHWVTAKPPESHREPFISKSMLQLFEEERTRSEPMLQQLGRITGIGNKLLRSFAKREAWVWQLPFPCHPQEHGRGQLHMINAGCH